MALALSGEPLPPPPGPITVVQGIDDLLLILTQVRHKLKTLIDWYIYPDIVPNEIQAYDPRLVILQTRLKSLATINYEKLPYLVDNSDAIVAHYLVVVVGQLLNSIHGVQMIFVNHYDRDLEDRQPFATIWETLAYRDEQFKLMGDRSPSNPRRARAEDLRANPFGHFCRGALQLSNHRDKGKISFVDKSDLLEDNRRKLKALGGAFLYWQCPECTYKVRYHVTDSAASDINHTPEIREHDGLGIQFRSSFLAKCHLYLPHSEKSRRESSAASAMAKYGCVFCFANGIELVRRQTTFVTVREFAEHMGSEHRQTLPPSLMLHRYLVAVEGKPVDNCKRWDLNFV